MRQAQEIKLASLGRLTASIAHNIRNPLSSVTHAAQLLAESDARLPPTCICWPSCSATPCASTRPSAAFWTFRGETATEHGPSTWRQWLPTFAEDFRVDHPELPIGYSVEILAPALRAQVETCDLSQILREFLRQRLQARRDALGKSRRCPTWSAIDAPEPSHFTLSG